MKRLANLIFLILNFSMIYSQDSSFLFNQLSMPRVNEANIEKHEIIETMFRERGINFRSTRVYWRAFKWNKALELWALNDDSGKFILVKTYSICEIVGDLGPKRMEGDFQIPEGFYSLTNFNPISRYHLSIKINYPNQSDQLLGNTQALGGDIYIHGNCETIGCIPMSDDIIKEIYIINLYMRAYGQEDIPFHIFPTKLTLKNLNKLKLEYFKENVELIQFWTILKKVYDYFERNRVLPYINVDLLTGKYIVE